MGFLILSVLLYIAHIQGLENLALHQPTWEQYPWPDKGRDFGSENAVDGMYTDRGTGGQCTISDDGKYSATWRVDLGGVVSINHINIYYMKDRHICNKNTYGQVCGIICGNCSNGETCHHINGTCLHGCAEGVLGDSCQEGCQSGYYGRNCRYRCSENCIVTSQCDRFTGRCDGGCKPGWTGNTCIQITNTQPSSCREIYHIVFVVVSVLIIVTGSLIHFVIWKRNAAKFSRLSRGNMPQPTSRKEDKDHQYTELEEVDKSKTYEEIHSYSN